MGVEKRVQCATPTPSGERGRPGHAWASLGRKHLDFGLKRSACSYPLVAQGPACHYGRSWAQGSCGSAPSYPHFRDGCQHSLLSFQIIPAPAPTPTQNEKACLRLRLRLAPLSPPIHTILMGLQEHGSGRPPESRSTNRFLRLCP